MGRGNTLSGFLESRRIRSYGEVSVAIGSNGCGGSGAVVSFGAPNIPLSDSVGSVAGCVRSTEPLLRRPGRGSSTGPLGHALQGAL